MILTFVALALADTVTLDTGLTLDADLARYESGGDCQLSITEGDLQGVIVILPCLRVVSFQRATSGVGVAMGDAPSVPVRAPVEVANVEAVAPPAMPDSVAVLAEDSFVAPLSMPADAPEEADEADQVEEAQDPPDDPSLQGSVRPAPKMPESGTRSISF